jgi:glucose-6-phosphate dehydrogenase assembly protein OpcA
VEEPAAAWDRAITLFDRTAVTDLRWTRLTPWRALMAHFFDIDEVRQAAARLDRLIVAAADRNVSRLFAGWLRSSLDAPDMQVELEDAASSAALEHVQLRHEQTVLGLRLRAGGTCVEAVVRVAGEVLAERVVSLRKATLPSLLREELRVRSRDLAFESALKAAAGLA